MQVGQHDKTSSLSIDEKFSLISVSINLFLACKLFFFFKKLKRHIIFDDSNR